jgi:hypothetical protein
MVGSDPDVDEYYKELAIIQKRKNDYMILQKNLDAEINISKKLKVDIEREIKDIKSTLKTFYDAIISTQSSFDEINKYYNQSRINYNESVDTLNENLESELETDEYYQHKRWLEEQEQLKQHDTKKK